jgi:hypothetical protein
MSGQFYHARAFSEDHYVGNDGKSHHELIPIDGDDDDISPSSWIEAVSALEQLGIPREAWPVYNENIDVPRAHVEEASNRLHALALKMPPPDQALDELLSRILRYLREGQLVFYCFS